MHAGGVGWGPHSLKGGRQVVWGMLSPEKQVPPSKSHVSDMGGVVEEAQ